MMPARASDVHLVDDEVQVADREPAAGLDGHDRVCIERAALGRIVRGRVGDGPPPARLVRLMMASAGCSTRRAMPRVVMRPAMNTSDARVDAPMEAARRMSDAATPSADIVDARALVSVLGT